MLTNETKQMVSIVRAGENIKMRHSKELAVAKKQEDGYISYILKHSDADTFLSEFDEEIKYYITCALFPYTDVVRYAERNIINIRCVILEQIKGYVKTLLQAKPSASGVMDAINDFICIIAYNTLKGDIKSYNIDKDISDMMGYHDISSVTKSNCDDIYRHLVSVNFKSLADLYSQSTFYGIEVDNGKLKAIEIYYRAQLRALSIYCSNELTKIANIIGRTDINTRALWMLNKEEHIRGAISKAFREYNISNNRATNYFNALVTKNITQSMYDIFSNKFPSERKQILHEILLSKRCDRHPETFDFLKEDM